MVLRRLEASPPWPCWNAQRKKLVRESWKSSSPPLSIPTIFLFLRRIQNQEMMLTTTKKPVVVTMLFLLTMMFACDKINKPTFSVGDCFVTSVNNKDVAIRIDELRDNNIKGKIYYADSLFATPHPFIFTISNNGEGGSLETPIVSRPVKIKWNAQGNQLVCKCRSRELPREIVLEQCAPRDTTLYHRQLCDPIYAVKDTLNVEYARAYGYWTSYPDEDKSFAEIYAGRLMQLKKKTEQSLRMDIYEPVDDYDALHPVVLMIHGGAFYNGDKQDSTYVKWCRHYASMGYVAVSLNYRMGFPPFRGAIDRAGYRATQDANAALRFLVHNAHKYRINPDLIFTWGTSAGAVTALNVAFMNDSNRPESVVKEGKINKLAPECPETFHVRAVANMWGAVHDTAILANNHTAIISFHSDRDGIVPYGYGIPFKDELISTMTKEIRRKIARFLLEVDNAIDNVSDLLHNSISNYSMEPNSTNRSFGDPLWELVFTPMYGSSCIHAYQKNHGVRSKLIPVPGTKHSLHVDEHRNIVPYFYTIQDTVASFFYSVIIPSPVDLHQESTGSQWFSINRVDVDEVHWQVDGGMLLETSDGSARVVFFRDAPHHVLRVSGRYKNGVEFLEELDDRSF